MRQLVTFTLLATLAITANVFAASKEEAQQMAEKAAVYIKSEGMEKAIPLMHDPKGEFVAGELYVFVANYEGVVLIHGANPKLAGKNLSKMKDHNGNLFIQQMVDTAKEKGTGWISYFWANPTTKKVGKKTTYIISLDEEKFLGVGVYE